MKKIVSILLVIVMVFSLTSASALSVSYHRHNYTKAKASSGGTHKIYCYYPGCTKYIKGDCDFVVLKKWYKKVDGKKVKMTTDLCTVCGRKISYATGTHPLPYCKH